MNGIYIGRISEIGQTILMPSNVMSHVGFRLVYLESTLAYSNGQHRCLFDGI